MPEPIDSQQPLPDHDQDAVYANSEHLATSLDRVQAPVPMVADWFLADLEAEIHTTLVHLIEYRAAGPPGEGSGTSIDLLPHLLRV